MMLSSASVLRKPKRFASCLRLRFGFWRSLPSCIACFMSARSKPNNILPSMFQLEWNNEKKGYDARWRRRGRVKMGEYVPSPNSATYATAYSTAAYRQNFLPQCESCMYLSPDRYGRYGRMLAVLRRDSTRDRERCSGWPRGS
jgi:hypothetical protein